MGSAAGNNGKEGTAVRGGKGVMEAGNERFPGCVIFGSKVVDGVPRGIRTPVIAVKGRCPGPG